MKGSFRAREGLGLRGVILGSLGFLGGSAIAAAPGCAGESAQPAQAQPAQAQPAQAQPAQAQPAPTQPVAAQPPPAHPAPTQPVAAQPPPAHPAPTQPAEVRSSGVTGPACVLKGTSPLSKNTLLFDAASGGRAIASFTGSYVPMTLSEIPLDPAVGRARLATSTGAASLRLEGFLPATAVPVFTRRDIPIVPGHIWISSAQKVKLSAAAPSSLTIELSVAGARNQSVRGSTPCDALALEGGTPTPIDVPGNARGYLTKESSIDIHNQPNGTAIFTLQMIDGSSQLFWSTETRAEFVHVQSRADLAIDGWIRAKDLDPLKKGEMMDQYIPPKRQVVGAQLALDKTPRIATAAKEIAIRARRDEKEKPIGVVEAGAEVYVMETIAGWTNVLPKSLHVVPPDDGGFWIPSGETPK